MASLVSTKTFETVQRTTLATKRKSHASIYVPASEGVLIVGGVGHGESPDFSEFWDRRTGRWEVLPLARGWVHQTQLLLDGPDSVIAAGGRRLTSLSQVERWLGRTWVTAEEMPEPMAGFSCNRMGAYYLLVGGDEDPRQAILYELPTKRWLILEGPKADRTGHCSVATDAQLLVVLGGLSTNSIETCQLVSSLDED